MLFYDEDTDFEPVAEGRLWSPTPRRGDEDRAPGEDVGAITYGAWKLARLPAPDRAADPFLPDPATTDLYLAALPHTLRLEGRTVRSVRVGFRLQGGAVAYDLLPRELTRDAPPEHWLSDTLRFVTERRRAWAEHLIRCARQSPIVSSYGEGEADFGWDYSHPDREPLTFSSRTSYVVLQTPQGLAELVAVALTRPQGRRGDGTGDSREIRVTLPPPARGRGSVRTLHLAFAVEGWDARRSPSQLFAEEKLVEALGRMAEEAGADLRDWPRHPVLHGGTLVVLPPGSDEARLIPDLVRGAGIALRQINRVLAGTERLRLRMALVGGVSHAGLTAPVGPAVSDALRLLTLPEDTGNDLTVAVSGPLHAELVADRLGDLDPGAFERRGDHWVGRF